jgi:adenine phosphoribosyltransferase
VDLSGYIRDVPDFPEPGILFKDIGPLLDDHQAFAEAVRTMSASFVEGGITHVAGIEARGFLFGPSVAQVLTAGFVPLRKPGKLPGEVIGHDYALEYGTDRIEVASGVLSAGDRVLLVDDVLATGGTLQAACALVRSSGAEVAGISVLIDLVALNGRSKLPDVHISASIEVN